MHVTTNQCKFWQLGTRKVLPCGKVAIWIEEISIYTERKKKRRVNFIPKFHSSLKKFVKYFTMVTKRYMYGTKVPNFIGL